MVIVGIFTSKRVLSKRLRSQPHYLGSSSLRKQAKASEGSENGRREAGEH